MLPEVVPLLPLSTDAVLIRARVNECINAALHLCMISQISPGRFRSASECFGTQAVVEICSNL